MISLNPLNVLKKRKVSHLPVHFSKMKINDGDLFDEKVENWIISKLSGRYSLVHLPAINEDNTLRVSAFVGFENHKELTYFALACPYIRRKT